MIKAFISIWLGSVVVVVVVVVYNEQPRLISFKMYERLGWFRGNLELLIFATEAGFLLQTRSCVHFAEPTSLA